MNTAEDWSVVLSGSEHNGETHAEARLIMSGGTHLTGRGTARRNPADENVTKIGEELAVARALSDLAHKLLHEAIVDIEAVTHQRAHPHM
jgi:Domain of unknown function (DUF1876)